MHLRKISIKNFKGIESMSIDFRDDINILIGDNGAGKTSVLAAIAVALGDVSYSIAGIGNILISKDDIRFSKEKIGDATYDFRRFFPVAVEGEFVIAEKQYHSLNEVEDASSLNKGKQRLQLLDLENVKLQKDFIYPIISYQRFDREWNLLPKDKTGSVVVKTGVPSREDGYKNFLNGGGYEEIIQQWCLQMALLEYERKAEIREFKTFQAIVENFMRNLDDTDNSFSVYYSSEVSGLVFDDGVEKTPIYGLSTGYRAVLSMIMELAYRTVILNPSMSPDLKELSGVVLIDEIDAHLHPKWQWRVVDALRKTFPKVQFIIATHSPMVISSVKNAKLINLDLTNGVGYLESAYGFSAGDVLTFRQGAGDMPEISKKYRDDLDAALDQGDLNTAKTIVDRAKEEYGEESVFYKELYQTYIINTWVEDVQ